MMRTKTELMAKIQGKKFKHSEMKKPYLFDSYEEMERFYSPGTGGVTLYPTSGLWQGNDLGEIGQYGTKEGEEGEKEKCDCPNCLTVSAILSELCCEGLSSIPFGFFIIGKYRQKIRINQGGFNDQIIQTQVQSLPIPETCHPDSSPCFTNLYTLIVDCEGEWTTRQIVLTLCGEDHTIAVKKGSCDGNTDCGCGTLTVSGVDTILTTGSEDYTLTGDCCGSITWSVAAASGSTLGSAAITSAGVLTAVGACGTLVVTATCTECGTSDTQDVRVTDSGNYELFSQCPSVPQTNCVGQTDYCYSGRYRHERHWGCLFTGNQCGNPDNPPTQNCDIGSCSTPASNICASWGCPGMPILCLYYVRKHEWKGLSGCI